MALAIQSSRRGALLVSWLAALLLAAFADPAIGDPKLDHGAACRMNSDCHSLVCLPYPNRQTYCRAPGMDCAAPGSGGLPIGYTIDVDGRTWMCRDDAGWQPSEKLANGDECGSDPQCASGRCSSNPDGHRYCLAASLDCADSRSNGVHSGYTMQYLDQSWTCIRGKGWGPARFSDLGDRVGSHRDCSSSACNPGDAGCNARQPSRAADCERLKVIEMELALPVSIAIVQGRDAAERAGVHAIPESIRARLSAFFPPGILDKVRYRVGSTENSELLRFAFQWLRTSAFVMDYVIIFNNEEDALHNVRLWAHELEHVIQYGTLGIDGFAQRWIQPATRGDYDDDQTTIEGAATARAVYVCSHIAC